MTQADLAVCGRSQGPSSPCELTGDESTTIFLDGPCELVSSGMLRGHMRLVARDRPQGFEGGGTQAVSCYDLLKLPRSFCLQGIRAAPTKKNICRVAQGR